ncbi:AAA family ATPase [Candidatus Uabimicrobium sp. HlEnr_7]|uniref:AAA family ATPase n=1 Tax=Candidatus Uabimicrobium helgolandensis TaxID=3095367 RepID=UPI00355749CB
MQTEFTTVEDVEKLIQNFTDNFNAISMQISQYIIGNKEIIHNLLIAFFSGGHVLLEGVPGVGKTSLVHALSNTLSLQYGRVQFTPDIMPADIIGTKIFQQKTQNIQFEKGPIFTNILLADEINRTSPKVQSALLQAMQEKQVTVGGANYDLPQPFHVVATQNPIEMEGTYPLPEAQLDRFFFKLHMEYPSLEELIAIVRPTSNKQQKFNISAETLNTMAKSISCVKIATPLYEYAAKIVINSNPQKSNVDYVKQYVDHGSSPRGMQAIISGAQVRALSSGRIHVNREDIETVTTAALNHRIMVNFRAQAEGISSFDVLQKLLENAKKA